MLKYKDLPEDKIKNINKLYNYFKDELQIDIIQKNKHVNLIQHRSLFNKILKRKYKLSLSCIAEFYINKGWLNMTHATVLYSINNFKKYTNKDPDLLDNYFYLHPSAKRKRDFNIHTKYIYKLNLTDIQKEVTDLTPDQEKELLEMIKLKKKSWLWKNNDKTKIYTAN